MVLCIPLIVLLAPGRFGRDVQPRHVTRLCPREAVHWPSWQAGKEGIWSAWSRLCLELMAILGAMRGEKRGNGLDDKSGAKLVHKEELARHRALLSEDKQSPGSIEGRSTETRDRLGKFPR